MHLTVIVLDSQYVLNHITVWALSLLLGSGARVTRTDAFHPPAYHTILPHFPHRDAFVAIFFGKEVHRDTRSSKNLQK